MPNCAGSCNYTSDLDLIYYMWQAGWKPSAWGHGLAIAHAEAGTPSSLADNTVAINALNPNGNAAGIFQLNPASHTFDMNRALSDPIYNAKIAWSLTNGGTDWSAWQASSGVWTGNISHYNSVATELTPALHGHLPTVPQCPDCAKTVQQLKNWDPSNNPISSAVKNVAGDAINAALSGLGGAFADAFKGIMPYLILIGAFFIVGGLIVVDLGKKRQPSG